MKLIDLVGQQFGEWVVIERVSNPHRPTHGLWLCKCKCGVFRSVHASNLRGKISRSCVKCSQQAACLPPGRSAFNRVFTGYQLAAKRRNLEWSLTEENALHLFQQPCSYCGQVSANTKQHEKSQFKYTGIDRLDNSKGYVKENCTPCCWVCNFMKRSLTVEDFKNHINKIASHINTLAKAA